MELCNEDLNFASRLTRTAVAAGAEKRSTRRRKAADLFSDTSPPQNSGRRLSFTDTSGCAGRVPMKEEAKVSKLEDTSVRAREVPVEKEAKISKFQSSISSRSDDQSDVFSKTTPPKNTSQKRKKFCLVLSSTPTSGESGKSKGRGKDSDLKPSAKKTSKQTKKHKKTEDLSSGEKEPAYLRFFEEDSNKFVSESFSDAMFCKTALMKGQNCPDFGKRAAVFLNDTSDKLKTGGRGFEEDEQGARGGWPETSDTELSPCGVKREMANVKRDEIANVDRKEVANVKGSQMTNVRRNEIAHEKNNEMGYVNRSGMTNRVNSSDVQSTSQKFVEKKRKRWKTTLNKVRPIQQVVPWNVLVEEQDSEDCTSEIFASCGSLAPAGEVTAKKNPAHCEEFGEERRGPHNKLTTSPRSHHGFRKDKEKFFVDPVLTGKFIGSETDKSGARNKKPSNLSNRLTIECDNISELFENVYGEGVKPRKGFKNYDDILASPTSSSSVQDIGHQSRGKLTFRSCRTDDTELSVQESNSNDTFKHRYSDERIPLAELSLRSVMENFESSLCRRKEASKRYLDDQSTAHSSPEKLYNVYKMKLQSSKRYWFSEGTLCRKWAVCPRALVLLVPDSNDEYRASLAPVVNRRSKRTVPSQGKPDTVLLSREDLDAYFMLLEDDAVVQELLERDRRHVYADNYLIAMVFVYFLRAHLPLHKYDRLHFFAALYLAHDVEEDDESPKREIVRWLVRDERVGEILAWEREQRLWAEPNPGHRGAADHVCQQQKPSASTNTNQGQKQGAGVRACKIRCMRRLLVLTRDSLFWGMSCRAIVSKATCEKVMKCEEHWAWQRRRPDHHGDCVRHSFCDERPRGNLLHRTASTIACKMCANVRAHQTAPDAAPSKPADGRTSRGRGEKDSGYESMLVGSGRGPETAFTEKKQNGTTFTEMFPERALNKSFFTEKEQNKSTVSKNAQCKSFFSEKEQVKPKLSKTVKNETIFSGKEQDKSISPEKQRKKSKLFSDEEQITSTPARRNERTSQLPKKETSYETSINTSDEIFPSAPQQQPGPLHQSPALCKTRRRLLPPLKYVGKPSEAELDFEAWKEQKLSGAKQLGLPPTNDDLGGHETLRRRSKCHRTARRFSCAEATSPKVQHLTRPPGAKEPSCNARRQPTPKTSKFKPSDYEKSKNLLPLFDHLHGSDSAEFKDNEPAASASGDTDVQDNEGNYFHASHTFQKNFMLESVKKWFANSKEMKVVADTHEISGNSSPLKAMPLG